MKASRILWITLATVGIAALWWGLWPDRQAPRPTSAWATEPARSAAADLAYGAAFDAELKKIGEISPQEFARRYGGKAGYSDRLSWDPTTAEFWDRLNLDPSRPGAQVRLRGDEERLYRERARWGGKPVPEGQPVFIPLTGGYDFRLNADELAAFKRNGFVVSERMGASSCTDMFYRIYKRDLPVFVTSDAVLHAWHRSYDSLLVEIEKAMLIPALDEILTAMAARVPDAQRAYGDGLCADSTADADYFLAVARSLLAGRPVQSALGQDERVARTLKKCDELGMEEFNLFGKVRIVDFSQFKPRGHYEKDEALRRYFKAMMWCGRIDLRVAGNPRESSEREMASAIVLYDLLQRAGKFDLWQQFDEVIQTFFGQPDSMTFAQLGIVLKAAGIRSPAGVKDRATLTALQARIAEGRFGSQEIRGHAFVTHPSNPNRFVLPRSFTFLGQRFTVDSWVTSKVVFDDIRWEGRAVMRRIPSCLDVAFAAFANDHAVPALADRMTNPAGRKFRDGLNYQHNLAAVRQVLDGKPEATWRQNLYTGWLGCLRELSAPTTDEKYPEALRTQAWAMKSLNTQLASWAQLRHDTVLYVKQSYTMIPGCHYPAGYVEPVPHFWGRLEQMVLRAAALIEQTPYRQPAIRQQHARFLRNFAARVTTLRGIAEKELAQKELTKEETKFLEDVIEVKHERLGSGAMMKFAGWYPGLFYLGADDARKWDALVADIHTNPPAPDVGDPGCVLHQGVGNIDLLVIAIDSGKDRMVYLGPVLSHYEFEVGGVSRKTDSEWQQDLRTGRVPPRPEWTRGYLVPGANKEAQSYHE
ncbi:MAG: DUF3160 domain-containing protein [Gemmataceae bacterium]|nr:DUF3160 domain-containing protein [Gemmataceae bacterium]